MVMVKRLTNTQKKAIAILETDPSLASVSQRTVNALVRKGYVRANTNGRYQLVTEMIGGSDRLLRHMPINRSVLDVTYQVGRGDYAFWDKVRRGKAVGLTLSGLLLKPIYSKIASWVMGKGIRFNLGKHSAAEDALNDWWAKNHSTILRAFEESVALGDCYLVLNPDKTLTLIPPHVIDPVVSDSDYGKIVGWRVDEVYQHPLHPERRMRIVQTYTPFARTRSIKTNASDETAVYDNLIGMTPVVHIANAKTSDEMFGRSEGEALVELLHRYGEILEAALDGNKRQGRPTPVFGQLGSRQEVDKFWQQYAKTRTITHSDGTTEIEQYLEFDADRVLALGGNATFQYVSPSPFTSDTSNLLGLLFYLYVQHSELPEFILGNAITASHASATAQMPAFTKFIEKKRGDAQKWVMYLAKCVTRLLALSDPEIAQAVQSDEQPSPIWDELNTDDMNLMFSATQWALEKGLIDELEALRQSPLRIENPEEVLERAKTSAQAKKEEFDATVGNLTRRLAQGDGADEEEEMPPEEAQATQEMIDVALMEAEQLTFTPPKAVIDNIATFIAWDNVPRNRGYVTMETTGFAHSIRHNGYISPKQLAEMLTFFSLHEPRRATEYRKNSLFWAEWLAHGGDEGRAWSRKVLRSYRGERL